MKEAVQMGREDEGGTVKDDIREATHKVEEDCRRMIKAWVGWEREEIMNRSFSSPSTHAKNIPQNCVFAMLPPSP